MRSKTILNDLDSVHIGDWDTFKKIFNTYHLQLRSFAQYLINNKDKADDIIQSVFEKLWKNRERYDFKSANDVKSFLHRLIRNECFDLVKEKKKSSAHISPLDERDVAQVADETPLVLYALIRSEIYAEIYKEIETLPPKCKKVIKLLYIRGKSNHEAADILGVSVHTVKNQRARGVGLLRTRILKEFLQKSK